jgi:hypothetical protein
VLSGCVPCFYKLITLSCDRLPAPATLEPRSCAPFIERVTVVRLQTRPACCNISAPARIATGMEIEQLPPNKPNFLLILALFGATILVIFVLAYFFVDFDGGHLSFRHHGKHPTSQLVLPQAPSLDARA